MCLPSFSLYYLLHQGIFHLPYSHRLPQCFISVFHPLPDLSQLYSSGSYSSESLAETAVGCSTLVKTPFLSSVWEAFHGQSVLIRNSSSELRSSLLQHNFFVFVFCIYVCWWCQVDWLAKHTLGWLIHQSTTIIFANSNLITKVPKCICVPPGEDWYDLLFYVSSDNSAEITSSRYADSTLSVFVCVPEVCSSHKNTHIHTYIHRFVGCILNHMIKSIN